MEKFLKFMSGKKWIIAVCIWVITTYLAAKGMIWESEIALIWWLQLAFFWKISYDTQTMYSKKK